MFKFFRNLRRSFLENNQVGKYMKYALGEVVLVVIGILIALQLNNLNEESKLRKEEQKLLIALSDEMVYNQKEIKRARGINQNNIKGTQELLELFLPEANEELTEKEVALTMAKALQLKTEFHPRFTVINSGQLNLLANEHLRNELLNLVTEFDNFEDAEQTVTQIRWDCTEMILEQGNFKANMNLMQDTSDVFKNAESAFENTSRAMFTSRVFENKLTLFMAISMNSEDEFLHPLSQNFDAVQQMLEEELKKFK
jgi:hypothetical protein